MSTIPDRVCANCGAAWQRGHECSYEPEMRDLDHVLALHKMAHDSLGVECHCAWATFLHAGVILYRNGDSIGALVSLSPERGDR